ncbi:MAG: hypothetical protein WAK16_03415 [Candidatus Cybelea sp.]
MRPIPGLGCCAVAVCPAVVMLAGCGGSGNSSSLLPASALPQTAAPQSAAGSAFCAEPLDRQRMTFSYTGAQQNFIVPERVKRLKVAASGAHGGLGGGLVKATIPVTPGESLAIFVGGDNDGFNGGASDVRQGGTAFANRVLVAGAGGGDGGEGTCYQGEMGGAGGAGGDLVAERGGGVGGGSGGTQTSGGQGGGNGGSGSLGVGGHGGVSGGRFGQGRGGYGGGGYFGGGGGGGGAEGGGIMVGSPCFYSGSGGGGGSSYAETSASDVTMVQGGGKEVEDGNGLVAISWR